MDRSRRRAVAGPAALVILAAIRCYKVLFSQLFAGSCRYVPSCADYTAEAVRVHGALRGSWLGLRRLGRCHPFGSSGFDPVPPASRELSPEAGRNLRAH